MKIISQVLAIILVFNHCLPGTAFAASKSLYADYRNRSVVRVFVAEPSDSTKDKSADPAGFKSALEKALSERKSINFDIVNRKEEADLIIEADITNYEWSETDPVDMLLGTGPIAYDMITAENYAYMEIGISVINQHNNKLLWKADLDIDLTKKVMPKAESIPLINEKAAKIFIRRCFSKRLSAR